MASPRSQSTTQVNYATAAKQARGVASQSLYLDKTAADYNTRQAQRESKNAIVQRQQ